ncbi:MAG: hypothetical protein WBY99_11000, partial [Kaistella sp.]
MTVEEIYDIEDISVRSLNLCKYNGFNSIDDLIDYYMIHRSFLKLRNCGRRSDEELIQVCIKYKALRNCETQNNPKPSYANIILNLNRLQRDVINSFIKINSDSLGVRSKNGISRYLDNNFKTTNFAEKILLSDKFNLNAIQNIGASSILELEIYISIIKEFIVEVSQSSNEKQLLALKNNFLIQNTFAISNIPNKILESESIFQLTDFLLNNDAFFNNHYTFIFK